MRINWDGENLTVMDVLSGMLNGINGEDYQYHEVIDGESLEAAIYEMVTQDDLKKPGVIELMRLDSLGIVGNKLQKLWQLCNEDKTYFNLVVSYISGGFLEKVFSKEEIEKNLALEHPVPFVPYGSEIISYRSLRYDYTNRELADKIIKGIHDNMVANYNQEAMKEYGPNCMDMLLRINITPEEDNGMKPDEVINMEKAYFGEITEDITGGVIGIHFSSYSLFEMQKNIIKVNGNIYYALKEIPSGEQMIIDEFGKFVVPSKFGDNDLMGLLPSKRIVSAEVVSLKQLLRDADERFGTGNIVQKYKDMIENKHLITVENIKDIYSDLISLYQGLYGDLGSKKQK